MLETLYQKVLRLSLLGFNLLCMDNLSYTHNISKWTGVNIYDEGCVHGLKF